jgi:hypothetical protein
MMTLRLADELVETLKERAEADAIPVTELVTRLLRRGLTEADDPRTDDEIVLLEQRLRQLEDRFEKSAGRFETLENLFTRIIPVFSRNS